MTIAQGKEPDTAAVLDLDQCLEKLYKGTLLSERVLEWLAFKAKELMVQDSNIVHIQSPVTMVGDIHGQFYDLLEIFKIGGYPPNTNYLFLGDYVDRGYHSIETITLLIVLKLKYPSRITLIRGNHESRQITTNYGFYTECVTKYGADSKVWSIFTDLFDFLVLSAIVDNTLFCVHGGLSPNVQTIESISVIDRFKEIPHDGPMADLMWSDPDIELLNFRISSRGAGYQFGINVVNKFLRVNGFEKIFRAHQLCNDGFQVFWKGKVNTVWSAPNYCYRCGNKASILEVFDDSKNPESFRFNVFDASPDSEKEFLRIESDNLSYNGGNGIAPFDSKTYDDNMLMDMELLDNGSENVFEHRMNKKAPYVEYFM
jgi:serine/threonine-protein phosphatase PPG1